MALQLTTIGRLKKPGLTDISIEDTSWDDYLTGVIAEVSSTIEGYIGHPILNETVTEVRNVENQEGVFWLRRRPVTSITSVETRVNVSTAWADATTLTSTSYDFDASNGKLVVTSTMPMGALTMRVIYVAGFATTLANLISNYHDIVSAAERQVSYVYRRRNDPGAASISIGGQSMAHVKAVDLLDSVKATLRKYRSYQVV